jgi:hypothetical protein
MKTTAGKRKGAWSVPPSLHWSVPPSLHWSVPASLLPPSLHPSLQPPDLPLSRSGGTRSCWRILRS